MCLAPARGPRRLRALPEVRGFGRRSGAGARWSPPLRARRPDLRHPTWDQVIVVNSTDLQRHDTPVGLAVSDQRYLSREDVIFGRVRHVVQADVHMIKTITATNALTQCEERLAVSGLEVLSRPCGVPCPGCLLTLCQSAPHRPESAMPSADAGAPVWADFYSELGWPVVVHRDQVLLAAESFPSVVVVSVADTEAPEVLHRLAMRRDVTPVLRLTGLAEWLFVVTATHVDVPLPAGVRLVEHSVPLPPARIEGCVARWIAPPVSGGRTCTDLSVVAAVNAVLAERAVPALRPQSEPKGALMSSPTTFDHRVPGTHWIWPNVDPDGAADPEAVDVAVMQRVLLGLACLGPKPSSSDGGDQ